MERQIHFEKVVFINLSFIIYVHNIPTLILFVLIQDQSLSVCHKERKENLESKNYFIAKD